jgi:hypothetical protein
VTLKVIVDVGFDVLGRKSIRGGTLAPAKSLRGQGPGTGIATWRFRRAIRQDDPAESMSYVITAAPEIFLRVEVPSGALFALQY